MKTCIPACNPIIGRHPCTTAWAPVPEFLLDNLLAQFARPALKADRRELPRYGQSDRRAS